jgi:hypothetical protein
MSAFFFKKTKTKNKKKNTITQQEVLFLTLEISALGGLTFQAGDLHVTVRIKAVECIEWLVSSVTDKCDKEQSQETASGLLRSTKISLETESGELSHFNGGPQSGEI